jgi:hypothetical protein
VVAGYGLVRLGQWVGPQTNALNRLKFNLLLLFIASLFLFEHLSLPLPQSDMRVPAAYDLIAADPNEVTVLDIPFAWRNGFRITGALTTQFMFGQFYQTLHQKRLLQGNTSRNPLFKFQYFTNAPVINSLLALETGKTVQQERWIQDRAIAADVLRFLNIGYIVVRPEPDNPLVTAQATIPYIEALLPVKKIHDEALIKVYRVSPLPPPPSPILIDSSQPLAPLYFAEGWGLLTPGQPMMAQRKEVRLLTPLTKTPHQLRLRLRLPEPATARPQQVYLELNGWRSEPHAFGPAWQELAFEIPAGPIRPGVNELRLHFENVVSLPFPGPETTILDVTVLSAGEEVGGFGHIYINGHQVSPNERGYNVAIIQPGRPVTVDYFDTHYYPAASAALGHYEPLTIRGADTIIAVAAADEASAQLDGEAIAALQSIGAKGDLRGCFRCSHALISEVGRPDGKTVEALDPLRPVGVTINLGLTEPTIAAVVDWIQVEPK